MSSGAINITPSELRTVNGNQQLFYINNDNQMDLIGMNTNQSESYFYNTLCGGIHGGTIPIYTHDKFVEAYNSPNTYVTALELSNGNKFVLMYGGYSMDLGWLDTNNVYHNFRSQQYPGGWENFDYDVTLWFFTIPSIPDKFGVEIIRWNSNHTYCRGEARVSWYKQNAAFRRDWSEWETLVNGAVVPEYNWTGWYYIRGNSGQYRANLTVLKDTSIPSDLFTYTAFSSNDFDIITNESSIWNAFLNSPLNEERTIAWSGKCRLTMTISNTSQDAVKHFTFKFYTPDAVSPFYTYEHDIAISSSTPSNNTRDFYLSFLYDLDNQVAVFYPIAYNPQSVDKYVRLSVDEMTESQMNTMFLWLMARDAGSGDPDNPYDTGTEDNGGNPSGYDGHQDDLINVTPPSLDGTSSGMFTIYCPDDTELTQIASFLWSDNVIDNFKKYFNNFSDNIIAFYVLPYKPQNLPTKAFKVGRVTSDTITSIEYVTNRFVTIDMGELVVDDKWDSYLDFGPYTKFNIYLPGIGVQALDADDIMCPANQDGSMPSELGSTIKLEYNMDLMTGIVVCFVKINGQIRYQFSGKIGYQIPLTGETHRTLMQGFAMATAGLIGTVATGGAAAPFAAAAASAAIINAMKPDVYRGGNLSGDAASLCYKTPYLIRRMPNKPLLVDQQKFTGYQSYKTGLLSEFSGYTECEDAHVEGISCTEDEREMIMDWLRKGVIL